MKIAYLAEYPQYLPLLARWNHEQWGYLYPKRTQADLETEFSGLLNQDEIPFTLVGLKDEKPVAMASLTLQDMDVHIERTPWLASVYVLPEYRKKGFGEKIVQEVLRKAQELQVQELYLYTPEHAHWYTKMGFHALEKTVYHGENITIMKLSF